MPREWVQLTWSTILRIFITRQNGGILIRFFSWHHLLIGACWRTTVNHWHPSSSSHVETSITHRRPNHKTTKKRHTEEPNKSLDCKFLAKIKTFPTQFAHVLSPFTLNSQEQDVLATWEKSSWAKKLESKKRRAAMTDFDRFKLMIAKKQKSVIVAAKIAEMSK